MGAFRVLVAVPRLGPGWALTLELPAMLAVAWAATDWLLARFAVAPHRTPRLAMCAVAILVLFAGEAAQTAVLANTRPAAWLAGLADPASWPGLAAQILAGLMPLLRRRAH